MDLDYAERLIAQARIFDDRRRPMPRWFSAKREAAFAELRRFYRTAPPKTVHHYTSSAALISIVTNNEIWLSDATYLNDRHEVEFGRKMACRLLKAQVEAQALPEVRDMLNRALSMFASKRDPKVFIACFSFDGDDLTQWRAYGGADAPISLEIEHGPFMFGDVSDGALDRVLYEEAEQQWVFAGRIAAYADAYLLDLHDPIAFERNGPPLTRDEEADLAASGLYHALWEKIVSFKDPAFVAEREVRFVHTAHAFTDDVLPWRPELPKARFRERNGRIIPYLSSKQLAWDKMQPSPTPVMPIRSVRIGPTQEPDLIARGVRELLDAFGHADAQVHISPLPFRPK